ncbi:hypothetical protein CEXT_500841 [Caerostris extrusa]|uniref:Uncharacterized protein n=1 Tax=Caerostris extrusa TaxID=172846 RepID=A0AAV4MWM9_CAEEX|nr:hypothetical protein CEXT_500841 [Caerostris extrusa]
MRSFFNRRFLVDAAFPEYINRGLLYYTNIMPLQSLKEGHLGGGGGCIFLFPFRAKLKDSFLWDYRAMIRWAFPFHHHLSVFQLSCLETQ